MREADGLCFDEGKKFRCNIRGHFGWFSQQSPNFTAIGSESLTATNYRKIPSVWSRTARWIKSSGNDLITLEDERLSSQRFP
jgi:hypothetical protein